MFIPSQYSHHNPPLRLSQPGSVVVSDGGGTDWEVFPDGSVKAVRSGPYPSVVGKLEPAGSQKARDILAILIDVSPSNASAVKSVIGQTETKQLPDAGSVRAKLFRSGADTGAPAAAAAGAEETQPGAGAAKSIMDEVWFWPAVILGSTAVLSAGILIVYSAKNKKK